MEKYKEMFIEFLIKQNCLKFGDFILKSKRSSPYFFNAGDLNDGLKISMLGNAFAELILSQNEQPDVLFGPSYKGIPLAVATSIALSQKGKNIGFTFDRKEIKAYGEATGAELQKTILIGTEIKDNDKIMIVEDVFTTGETKYDTLALLNKIAKNLKFLAIIIAIDRQEVGIDGKNAIKEFTDATGIPVKSIVSISDILEYLKKDKIKYSNDINRIENYLKVYGTDEVKKNLNISENSQEKINLADRLLNAIDKKQNSCVVGLDPVIEKIPKQLINGNSFESIADAIRKFNYGIIDAVADLIPAVKPQIAFYEKYGPEGIKAFKDTVDYAKSKGLIVIEDGKRNDISSTAQAYAEAHLGKVKTQTSSVFSMNVDLLTVNPYLGSDGLKPFIDVCKEFGKGIFILVKTSNPSSGELQDRLIEITSNEKDELKTLGVDLKENKTEMYKLVGLQVNKLAQQLKGNRGYSSIGAVVGATYPEQAIALRKIMPDSIFLVPGYGAQGGRADDVVPCFNNDGYGAVVNSSRGIIFAYEKSDKYKEDFAQAAREATLLMIKDINSALSKAGKLPAKWNF